jgi:thermolysin/neutral peptidase B
VLAGSGSVLAQTPAAPAAPAPATFSATRASVDEMRAVDSQVNAMINSRELRVRSVETDAMLPTRQHERLDQYLRGVRIVGGVTRQIAPDGTVSVFGTIHNGLDAFDTNPRIAQADAGDAIARALGGVSLGRGAELVVLPLSDGYHLAYFGQASVGLEIVNAYIDANTGGVLQRFSDFTRDVGTGHGAYGDAKKVSTKASSGAFITDDPLRPAPLTTYDMRGNLTRLESMLNGLTIPVVADIGTDTDNVWTDPTLVDAHVYMGWYYDFLQKRFGRKGLDNNNGRLAGFTHPVVQQNIGGASSDVVGLFYINAFYCPSCLADGRGAMVFGEGAPANYYAPGVTLKPFSADFGVVAHELTHGVTAYTAGLNGFQYSEAGALNEGFSDMFGVSTEFFYEAAGNTPLTASYLLGRDLSVPAGVLARSLANPASTGDPDHYTKRIIGGDPHYNSTIASHAFYLAIEGGTNRTSGLTVQGVGAANRDQVEKSFFRALTVLLPPSATFALTRLATIQAARDLYGTGTTVERAITQAWDAVGVQARTTATAAMLPNPDNATSLSCGGDSPSWTLGVTVSAGSSNLRVSQWVFDQFNATGTSVSHQVLSASQFASFFNQCGPGSSSILAQTDACALICSTLGTGVTTGSAQVTFTAVDSSNNTLTFVTPLVSLLPPQ